MIPPTIWPARRAGDRILCGRMVDGRYVCTGELATVSRFLNEQARLPPGIVIGPTIIGVDRVAHVRLSARAERQEGEGRLPDGNAGSRDRRNDGSYGLDYWHGRKGMRRWASRDQPFTRHCPHCGMLAFVSWPLPS